MMTPDFITELDDRNVRVHLDKLPPALRENLRKTISALTDRLLVLVRAAEPSRTGYLRSQTRAFVDSTEDYVRGRVRIVATGHARQVAAAFGALEYGAHRRFAVSGYQREGIAVQAYARTANIAERRFLRGSLASMREQAMAEIEAAVGKAVDESAT